MSRMKVLTVTEWGPDGVQVTYQVVKPVAGYVVNLTEMATLENAKEFERLQASRVRDVVDVTFKVVS